MSKKNVDKVVDTNLFGTINILKKIKKDKSKIIFLSTSRVYSIKNIYKKFQKYKLKNKLKINISFDENFKTTSPKSIYGLTKHASEMFIEEFSYAFKIKYIINRLGVVSGPLQFGKQDQGFVSLWLWRHITKKNLKYIGFYGFGNQVRDIIHIEDLCEIIEKQIKKFNTFNNKIFTIGGSKNNAISLKDLTKLCQKITNNKVKFKKIKKTSMYDIPYYVSSNKFISSLYDWKPKKSIIEILKDTYDWLNTHKENIKKYM